MYVRLFIFWIVGWLVGFCFVWLVFLLQFWFGLGFFVFILVTYRSIDSVLSVWQAGQAGGQISQLSCITKTLTLDITRRLFNQILSYLPCLFAPFYTTFSDLDLGWDHKVSTKQW